MGTQSITASDGAITGAQSGIVVNAGGATKLALSGSTADLASGSTRVLTATIQDTNGNTITTGPNSTSSVTFAETSGTGTVTGLGSSTAVAGVATLTVTGNAVGSVTITASATGLAPGTGNPISFNVVAGAASKLVITGSVSQTGGTSQNLTITAKDASGNTAASYTGDKSLTFSGANSSSNPVTNPTVTNKTGTAVNFGTAETITFSNGVVTVSGSANGVMTLYKAETATIAVTDGTISAASTDRLTVTVSAGTFAKFALSLTSPQTNAGVFTGTNTLTAQDSWGNTVTTFNAAADNVTIVANAPLTGTVSGLGSGGNNILNQAGNFSSGVANLTTLGMKYTGNATTGTFTATSGSGKTGTSGSVTINGGTLDHFSFATISNPQTAGTAFSITVTAQDAGNNTVTSFDANGNKAMLTSTGALTGAPITSAAFTAGVLTQNVTITNTGNFTITATGSGGNSGITGTSNSFQVNPGSPTHLVYLQQPTTAQAGVSIAPPVTVQLEDANNNVVTTGTGSTASVGIAILTNPGSGTLSGTTPVNAVAGVATFSDLSVNKTGTGYTLQATSSGLTSVTSNGFNITPAVASKLVFGVQPSNTTAGVAISPAVSVQVQDQFGNLTTSTAAVGIAIVANPSSGTLSGTTPVNAVSGTATFSDLSINKGGLGYTLQASSAGLTSATSGTFTINNPAPTLTSIAPTSANLSDTLDVVFNGTNYISGVTMVSFGANITVNTVTVNSSIKLTANITIESGATVGPRNVSVTNPSPGGGTATLTNGLTVNNPATTTVVTSSSVANTSTYGESVTFTATVSTASGTPTGGVTFYDSASCSGTVLAGPTNLDANGKATFTTTSLTVPGHTITGCYTPTGIYLASNGSVTQTVNKRPATWTTDANSKTYGAADPVPLTTGSGTGFLFSDNVTASYSRDSGETVAGGPYHITATLSPGAVLSNYDITNAGADFTIAKRDATVVVTAYTVPYNGHSHTATVTSITGVNGETGATVGTVDVSNTNHTSAGTYATDTWSFTGTANYNNIAATTITDTISKADATVVVAAYTVPYNGHSHTATITSITGVNGETGATVGTVDVSNTNHTSAGTYASDTWSFTGAANYNDIAAKTITDTISKADATVVVAAYNVPYNGHSHTATVTSITGVNGETGATVGTVDVSNTNHTSAGTYASDTWSFTGAANYNNIAATIITDTISKADATVVVAAYTSATTTYDGIPHTATIMSITGVNSETGVTVGTVDVSNTTHTPAGTYSSDTWSFTGTANYNNIGNTTITDSIGKATATVVVTPYTSLTTTYNGNPHTATITSIAGVNSETGVTVGTVDVSNTTHTNAGTYSSDTWSFTGTANYNSIGNTTITDSIGKANATVVVTPYTSLTTTYNGNPHTATITSIAGVNSETGVTVGTVDVSHTTHTPAGTYASDTWSFTGAANYNDIGNTTITDSIGKATAVVVVTPYTSLTTTYDGNPHTATITSITGVNSETGVTVGTVDVSHTTHTPAGTYASDYWFFTGTANYNDIGNTAITDSIGKATATVVVTPYTSLTTTYDGNPHTATITSITGVHSETGATVGAVDVSHTTHTPAGTYAMDYWFFTGTANYNDIGHTTITDSIGKAHLTVTADNQSKTYDGSEFTAFTATLTGFVDGETSSVVSGAPDFTGPAITAVNAGTYTISSTVGTLTATNYDFPAVNFIDGTLTISKAHLTVTADNKSKTYDTATFTAFTATVSGFVNGEILTTSGVTGSANFSGAATTAITAGTYIITPTVGSLSATNYDFPPANFVNGTLTIKKADAVVTVNGYTGTYNGHSHGASGTVTGVDAGGAALGTTLDLGATFTNVPGGTAYWTFTGGTNYNNQSSTVAIVINKVHLTVTADNKSKTYNGAVYSPFAATLSGFVNSETDAGLRLAGALSGNAGFVGAATNAVNAGTYTITPTQGTLSATNYDFTTFYDGTLTIGKVHLTVTADVKTVQYSDPLPSLTATLSGFVNSETDAGLRLSGALSGNASYTTAAAITFYTSTSGVSNAPGTYMNAIIPSLGTLSATNYDFPAANFVKATLTVTQEDARATYAGTLFASTSSSTSSTAIVTLSATIQDITAVTGDPAYDPYLGDIRNAKVTFINRDTNTVINMTPLAVGLVNAGDTKTGTVTYNWSVDIGSNDSLQYTIGIMVTNYYTRNNSADDTLVTVSKWIPGSITGGGYLVMQKSAGLYPGGGGTKNNFGFNVKNASNGPKGNINTIIRNNGRVYQIKGNSMTSLSTKLPSPPATTPATATFNGKANIQDITNPLTPISIDGNAALQVTMTDNGEPGSSDTIAITVWNKSGGMWFSSNWTGTMTQEQTLGGGNVQVH